MAQIFSVSRIGLQTEYDTLDYAITAGDFVIIKYTPVKDVSRFLFYNNDIFETKLNRKNWTLRITYYNDFQEISYDIIDSKGRVQHFRTKKKHFEGISECVERFASMTESEDFKDIEVKNREQALSREHSSLQVQIDELRNELELLKRRFESVALENK